MINNNNGMIKNNINVFAVVYRIIDLAVIHLMLIVALYGYSVPYTKEYFELSLIASIGFFLTAESFALYRSWRAGFFNELMFYTFISWAFAAILVITYMFFTKQSADFSRIASFIWFLATFLSLITWRFLFNRFLAKIRRKGMNTRSVAIIGITKSGQRLAQQILDNPDTGFRLTAIFDDRIPERIDATYHAWLEGDIKEGVERAKNNEFDVVYIALPMIAEERIKHILQLLGDTTANVQLVPDLFVYTLMNASMSHIGNIQTISVYDNPMRGGNAALKRFEDIAFSLVILTLISIPLLFIAIAVKVTSKGPVIFKQNRYGLDGKKIKVYKFRSMTVTENSDVVTQATKGDARITPLGAFLRRTSLDELPQFINVLQGRMSVVGPRPHAVAHNESYRKEVDYYMLRHKVRPGITGWAQVNGWRGETDTIDKMEMRIKYDLEYIRNWTLWLDVKIIVGTVFKSFNDKNAY
ncbi:undecaprenyl-phosphate glucose phosphotransferase [Pseudocolwellia sp. AS88]|uniref:undecaprenyl-phosphate glucose phosphotransferase n=1 Tax=Pseudocolwellia sp. AS88 TaxID=3063958 RepID=UPI0026EBE082|nr:undecaprenyl-phosphate glucose phosphotransferase [Pseudocolwellia sp. AS88]MDO7086726.1 undecaprenyl-phosphate glucose phosphotransferase [Pseudocolwellia sp. AS88]